MPRNPVAASRNASNRAAFEMRATTVGAGAFVRYDSAQDSPAQIRLSAAQAIAVRCNPIAGANQNAIARTPTTAPAVLHAYKDAIERGAPGIAEPNCDAILSMAGKVAPIAAVAGSS